MKIWIVQTGEPLHCDEDSPRPMRAMNLANIAVRLGHEVTIISSRFYHQKKEHRKIVNDEINISRKLKIILIDSPGYNSNLSLSRLWDHFVLALNLNKKIKKISPKPDIVFIGFPPMEIGYVMSKWLYTKSIPFIVDVKDQWPSFIVSSLPKLIRPFARMILHPYFYISKKTMNTATGITTMADAFLKWAEKFSQRSTNDFNKVVPLTSKVETVSPEEMEIARQWAENVGITGDKLRVMFLGSHYPSLNFDHIFYASENLNKLGFECEFIICGKGQLTDEIKVKSKNNKNIILTGWVDRPKINAIAEKCSLSIAPFRNIDNYTSNLPNKIIDYLSLGLPILSPLEGELSSLISKYNIGYKYDENDLTTLHEGIMKIFYEKKINQMRINSLQTYKSLFDFDTTYEGLVRHLEKIYEIKKNNSQ